MLAGNLFISEYLLCKKWLDKIALFLHVDSKDSNQTGRKLSLIGVFAVRYCFVVHRWSYA